MCYENITAQSLHNQRLAVLSPMDPCAWYSPCQAITKFWILLAFGTPISLVAIINNTLVFWALIRNRQHRTSSMLFLIFLAAADVTVSVCFVMLQSMRTMIENWHEMWPNAMLLAHRAWFFYIPYVMAAGTTALAIGAYLIIFALLEKLLLTSKSSFLWLVKDHRFLCSFTAIVIGLFANGPRVFEVEAMLLPNYTSCALSIDHWQFTQHEVAAGPGLPGLNGMWYRVYLRTAICIPIPFASLLILNVLIIFFMYRDIKDRKCSRKNTYVMSEQTTRMNQIQASTRMVFTVVCTWLMANALNVFVLIMEFTMVDVLRDAENHPTWFQFYMNSADIINVMTALAIFMRLPIYLIFNPVMRQAIRELFHCVGGGGRRDSLVSGTAALEPNGAPPDELEGLTPMGEPKTEQTPDGDGRYMMNSDSIQLMDIKENIDNGVVQYDYGFGKTS